VAKLELRIDSREVWSAYADRLYSGDKIVKSITEMLQNSVDAGARNVNIDFLRLDEAAGTWRLIFADDGCGMSADIFLNRFLCLGASRVGSTDGKTGGNGVAKAIILFNRFVSDFLIVSRTEGRRIQASQADILSGHELEDIEVGPGPVGTSFTIEYKDQRGLSLDRVKEMLRYAALPNLKVRFNGESIEPAMSLSPFHSDLTKYPTYSVRNPGWCRGHLIVLSNGCPQFADWVGGEQTYVINLTPSSYRDFTPSREQVMLDSPLYEALQILRRRVRYETENPITSAKAARVVKRRLTYNLRSEKKKRPVPPQPVEYAYSASAIAAPPCQPRAETEVSGRPNDIEREDTDNSPILEELIPLRGVVFENCQRSRRIEWHPERKRKYRKLLALIDRYIEIFESELSGLEVANIGLMYDYDEGGHWEKDKRLVMIDAKRLSPKMSVAAREVLFVLTHELAHNWQASHNENFTAQEGKLLAVVATQWSRFVEAQRAIRKVK